MNQKQLYHLLLRSLDQPLKPQEQQRLEEELSQSAELRARREELLRNRERLGQWRPRPDPAFTTRVMARWERYHTPKTVQSLLVAWFPRVAAACLLILLLAILGTYLSEGSLNSDVFIGTQDLTVEDAYSLTLSDDQ